MVTILATRPASKSPNFDFLPTSPLNFASDITLWYLIGIYNGYVALVVYFWIILSHVVGNFKFEVFKVLSIFYPSLMMNDALKFHASLISMRIISILGSSYYHLITANNKNSLWIIINEVLGELQFLWLSFHGVFFITINNKNSLWIIEVLGKFLWLSFYGVFWFDFYEKLGFILFILWFYHCTLMLWCNCVR